MEMKQVKHIQQKHYWIFGIIAIIIISGLNFDIIPHPRGNINYEQIPCGKTDENGKYILRIGDEVGTIFVKDAVTGNPVPNINLTLTDDRRLISAEPHLPALSTISIDLTTNLYEEYYTEMEESARFISEKSSIPEATILIIPKNAPVDEQSAIQIARSDERVKAWASKLERVGEMAKISREGKWRVFLQGVKGFTSPHLVVDVDPKTGEVSR